MKKIWMLILIGLVLTSFGLYSVEASAKGPIVVASKIDTEGALLGQMIIALLKADGFDVKSV